ncbi:glycosyl hydrolase family 18 protein [Patescibacteria group bacterium]|nr:glycosyl hydrolase family 18 protein [Patescibacteria group bacterium]
MTIKAKNPHTKYMREEYIRIIKEYIKLKPEYKLTLEEIRTNILTVGATEEELNAAIKQLTGLPFTTHLMADKSKKHSKPARLKKFNLKRTIGAFSILVLSVFTIYSFSNFPKTQKAEDNKTSVLGKKTELKKLIPVVFANTKPIDAEKVFSYPKSGTQAVVSDKPQKEVFGFFPYWMLDKSSEIDLEYLTSISIFGIEINSKGGIVTADENGQLDGGWSMWNDPRIDGLIRRAKDNNLKVYITLKSLNNDAIQDLIRSPQAQKAFISNAIYLVNSKNLDGINLDFEFVGIAPADIKTGFVRLTTNLNAELKRQAPHTTLTVCTYIHSASTDTFFDIPLLAQVSDAFVVMGYDMSLPFGPAGPIAAMGGKVNVESYLRDYLENVSADKIILAVPYYGYDWAKTNNSQTEMLSYAQIAEESRKYQIQWDSITQTPSYTYTAGSVLHEVHFDNIRSLGIKYDLINKQKLKGVGIWALGYDGQNADLQKLIVDKFYK